MGFFNRISGIEFIGFLAVIIAASALGCIESDPDKKNSSFTPDRNVISPKPESNITFVTTGSSFSPIITVTGNPEIQ